MKKRLISMLLSVSLLVSLFTVSGSAATADQAFTDISSGAWYYDAVQYVYENGLMNGMGDNKFEPDTTLSRAMFVTILGRMAGIDEDDYTGSTGFTDAPAGSWYSPYIKWAAENGIVNGMTATTFAPDNAITREQMAAILVRYVENNDLYLPNSSKAIESFVDEASISEWAEELVDQARAWGIFEGDNGKFTPQSNATRAQAATVFMRLAEYLYLSSPEADSLMDTDEEHIATDEDTGVQYVDNTVLAFIQNYLTDEEKQSIADLVDGEIVGQLSGALDMLQIQVEVSTLTELEAMEDILETSELVDSVTYDMLTNVVYYESDTSDSDDWWQEMIGLDDAWDEFGDYFGDITVGVLDSRLPISAIDAVVLNRVTLAYPEEISYTYDPLSFSSTHGLTVCSLLAGTDGVARNANIVYARRSVEEVSYTRDKIAAIQKVVELGCRIINYSGGASYYLYDENTFLTSTRDDVVEVRDELGDYDTYLKKRTQEITESATDIARISCQLLERTDNILFVQAAGNGWNNVGSQGYPATLSGNWDSITNYLVEWICNEYGMTYQELKDHILVVTATDDSYDYTGYCYGEAVDIAAPQDSTSYATPLVSGTAALIWAAEPTLTAAQVKEILVTAYQHLATSNDYSGTVPVLNTYKAVQKALYASYTGTILNADNTPADGIYVYAEDADGNVLSDDVTDSNGEYLLSCNRLEIDHVSVYQDDEEVLTIDVSDEYQTYDYYAALYDDEDGYAPHDLGETTLPVNYLDLYAEVLEEHVGTTYRFAMAYIDEDDIPELLIAQNSAHSASVLCYFCQDNSLLSGYMPGAYGCVSYVAQKNVVWGDYMGMGLTADYFVQWSGNQFTSIIAFETLDGTSGLTAGYYIDNVAVTSSVYEQRRSAIINSYIWSEFDYYDVYSVTTANINNLLENPETYIIG